MEEFHTSLSATVTHEKGTTKSELKRFMYNNILTRNRCTATQDAMDDTGTWQQSAHYTNEEINEWKLIAEEVKALQKRSIN